MYIQDETDMCIKKFRSQYQKLLPIIQEHGLPIRMYRSSDTCLWRFDDGFEYSINEMDS